MKYNKFIHSLVLSVLVLNIFLPVGVVFANDEIVTFVPVESVDTFVTELPEDSNSSIQDELENSEEIIVQEGDVSIGENDIVVNESESITKFESQDSVESLVSETEVALTKTVSLHVRDGGDIIFEGDVIVSVGETIEISDNTDSLHRVASDSVLAVLSSADLNSDVFTISDLAYFSSFDSFLLNCIEIGLESPVEKCYNWQYVVEDTYPQIGMNSYTVQDGDDIYLYFGNPKRVVSENDHIIQNGIFYAKAEKYSYVDDTWEPIVNEVVGIVYPDPNNPWSNIEVATSTTNSYGRALLTSPTLGDYNLGITSDFYYPSTPIIIEEEDDRISTLLRVRNGDDIVLDKVIILDKNSTVGITDSSDISVDIDSDSVLNLLNTADQESGEFNITNLTYYPSFDSFLINCVEVSLGADPFCFNWQYAVNGSYPFVGMNSYKLNNNDRVFFYFGQQKRLSFDTTTISVGTSLEVSAEEYDYENNLWNALVGVTVGKTVPNPLDTFSPTEIATSTVNSEGKSYFVMDTIGEYNFGIKEDYYYPLYSINVVASTTGGTTGGGNSISHNSPDREKMLTFLDNNQKGDGSFGADLYTDWAAMAYGSATGHTASKNKLKEFLKTDDLDKNSSITDYERRAMALMALGVNPYTGGIENYVSKIINSFDGAQFGDPDLFNDDIFAIITLRSAGYSSGDDEIIKARDFIISKQDGNGSFDSPDITAATIQALKLANESVISLDAIEKAKNYILGLQVRDGGFASSGNVGNNFSTSWILGALSSVSVSANSLTNNNKNPFDYLYSLQQIDGGIEDEATGDINSRVWATSYAIVGSQEKTWNSIMKSFGKNTTIVTLSNSSDNTATSTPVISEADFEAATTTTDVTEDTNPSTPFGEVLGLETTNENRENVFDGSQTTVKNSTTSMSTKEDDVKSDLEFAGETQEEVVLWFGGVAILGGVLILIRRWIFRI